MKEKHKKSKKHKHKKESREKKRRRESSSSSSESDEWVEKETKQAESQQREDWMAMTGMLKTYTSQDIKPKRDDKEKNHVDSYDPGTCSRELNPYWKNGGTGLPQTPEEFRKSRPFVKPSDEEDYYKSSSSVSLTKFSKPNDDDDYYTSSSSRSLKSSTVTGYNQRRSHRDDRGDRNDRHSDSYSTKSYNWKSNSESYSQRGKNEDSLEKDARSTRDLSPEPVESKPSHKSSTVTGCNQRRNHRDDEGDKNDRLSDSYSKKSYNWKSNSESGSHRDVKNEETFEKDARSTRDLSPKPVEPKQPNLYLSDEKMNKLAAKIVKAEIMGDTKTMNELKVKLEAAREYRKQNPDGGKEDDEGVMLMSTNAQGNSRPLVKADGDPRSKGGKRKAQTHEAGERMKYFANDDKYDLAQMFQEEKYGNKKYEDEAELAKITSKHKNPNDDLEDIFMDNISKNRNEAKEAEDERRRAISQHVKLERSLEGCEYCVDSKSMLKHLMVTCGNKIYLAMPSKQSLVWGQCIITTIQHATCVTALDEDVWEEVMNFRKALTQFFNSKNQDVVFYETATRLHRFPHMVINCVPLPRDVGDMAAIYFKKALLECEAEWSMNKKVVELRGKNIRKGVPKGLPYFWIDFGMDPGFAHVIEDQQLFPRGFAEEVIGGFLDIDHYLWKNPKKEYGDLQRKKVVDFIKEWKPFEALVKQKE